MSNEAKEGSPSSRRVSAAQFILSSRLLAERLSFLLAGYGPEAISAEDKPNQTQSPFVCLSFLLWFHEFKKRE